MRIDYSCIFILLSSVSLFGAADDTIELTERDVKIQAFHKLCEKSGPERLIEVEKMLQDDPTLIKGKDKVMQWSVLMYAIHFEKCQQFAKWLIEHGADVHEQDTEGWTPLMLAANHQKFETVQLLLARGAEVNVQCNDNADPFVQGTARWTPLMRATRVTYNKEIVRSLLTAGAQLNVQDHDGNTILHYMHMYGSLEEFFWLMHLGVDRTIKNNEDKEAASYIGDHTRVNVINAFPHILTLRNIILNKMRTDASFHELAKQAVNASHVPPRYLIYAQESIDIAVVNELQELFGNHIMHSLQPFCFDWVQDAIKAQEQRAQTDVAVTCSSSQC